MTEHTEGPWEVEKDTYLIWTEGGGIPISCGETNRRWHRELTHEERQANAQLIAAAPETAAERDVLKAQNAELLAALEKIKNISEYNAQGGMSDAVMKHGHIDICALSEKAIANATQTLEGGKS